MQSSRGPQGRGDLLVQGDCFVASLLAMTLCCHREARRAVAIFLCKEIVSSLRSSQ